jgi:HEPN domain-containing protein
VSEKKELIRFWIEGSNRDYKTMLDLFNTKNYSWSLFLGHLVVEKLLKALYIKKQNERAPLIHDLRRIAEKAGIEIDDDQKLILDTITRFNISARYDDYKDGFYRLCSPEFTNEWIGKISDITRWIKKELSD